MQSRVIFTKDLYINFDHKFLEGIVSVLKRTQRLDPNLKNIEPHILKEDTFVRKLNNFFLIVIENNVRTKKRNSQFRLKSRINLPKHIKTNCAEKNKQNQILVVYFIITNTFDKVDQHD